MSVENTTAMKVRLHAVNWSLSFDCEAASLLVLPSFSVLISSFSPICLPQHLFCVLKAQSELEMPHSPLCRVFGITWDDDVMIITWDNHVMLIRFQNLVFTFGSFMKLKLLSVSINQLAKVWDESVVLVLITSRNLCLVTWWTEISILPIELCLCRNFGTDTE